MPSTQAALLQVTWLAGFYLIPELGLPMTMMSTSVVNIFAFLFFYAVSGLLKVEHTDCDKNFASTETEPNNANPLKAFSSRRFMA